MGNLIELAVTCALISLYLESLWLLVFDCFYLTLPWFAWSAMIMFILLKFVIHLPPANDNQVRKVFGVDPREIESSIDDSFDDSLDNEETEASENEPFCLRVIAHRGAGFDYPENSLSAFNNTRQKGCDAIEFDLALTKDKIPIVFHDDSIYRLTGHTGYIKEMTWEQLKDYDISTTHCLKSQFEFDGEKIALFDKVLQETLQSNQRMFIDIKAVGNEAVETILDAFKKYPELHEKAVISSFNPVTIYNIRKKDPQIIGGMAYRPKYFSYLNYDGLQGAYEPRYSGLFMHLVALTIDIIFDWAFEYIIHYVLGLSFVLLHKDLINSEVVRLWNNRNIRVFAWTVNLPSEKTHFMRNLKVPYLTDTLLS